jgi:hypothetical protein
MKVLYTAAVIAALAAAPSWGACTYPTAPGNMPDGNTATRDDMLAAKKQVQEFDKLITAYTECLKLENDAALAKSADLTPEQKTEMTRMLDQKHNAAVEAAEGVATRFNEQLKVFNAKNKK